MRGTRPFVERLRASHPYTAWRRYADAKGDLLAGGLAYAGFFSIFPALALGAAVFGIVLRDRPGLLEAIADYLNGALPGLVRTPANPDGVIGLEVPETSILTLTGLVAVAVLLLAGLGWVGAMRTAIRLVFGVAETHGNVLGEKLRDLAVLVSVGVGVVLSTVLTSAVGALADTLAEWLGLASTPVGTWVVTGVGLVLGLAFDVYLVVLLLRVLSGVPLPWAHVRDGAVFGAIVLTVLKYFGGVLIARASANPLLASVALAVGLLFWLNLMSRVVLMSAAWAANDVDVARLTRPIAQPRAEPVTEPTYAAEPASRHTASRAVDRMSVAAGVVLGAVGAATALGAGRLRRGRSAAR